MDQRNCPDISPRDAVTRLASSCSSPLVALRDLSYSSTSSSLSKHVVVADRRSSISNSSVHLKELTLGPAPMVRKTVESFLLLPLPSTSSNQQDKEEEEESSLASIEPLSIMEGDDNDMLYGMSVTHRLGLMHLEQDRLKAAFLREWRLSKHPDVIRRFEEEARDLVDRQTGDLLGAMLMDNLRQQASPLPVVPQLRVSFKHSPLLQMARQQLLYSRPIMPSISYVMY